MKLEIILKSCKMAWEKMPQKFRLTHEKKEGVIIISLFGYFDKTGGATLRGVIQTFINEKNRLFGFNCAGIELMNSQGITSLLDIAATIVDENHGKMVLFEIPPDKVSVLDLAGLFFVASQVSTKADALKKLGEKN